MKKIILIAVMVLLLPVLFGCKKTNIELKAEDIHTDTILVREDGTVQSAIVEEFGKEYYDLSELDAFTTKEIEKYNKSASPDAITKQSLILNEGDAVLILNYTSLEHYNAFNEVKSSLYSAKEALANKKLPDSFLSVKDGSSVSKETALKNEKYKVFFINADTDVIVNGKIMYYDNAVLVNKNKVEASTKGEGILIFKP